MDAVGCLVLLLHKCFSGVAPGGTIHESALPVDLGVVAAALSDIYLLGMRLGRGAEEHSYLNTASVSLLGG